MISRLALSLSLSCLVASAQNGLTDIPDPDVSKQIAGFNLPEGMEINLFASDPMIAKPVQMNWDSQGRLWLVSSGMYPHIVPGAEENDKVLVLEDTDGNGSADERGNSRGHQCLIRQSLLRHRPAVKHGRHRR